MSIIIVVTSVKGGVAKSTSAQGLAYHLQSTGLSTVLVDADPQGTTSEWCIERNKNSDCISIDHEELQGKIHLSLQMLARKYDAVVVDCGGSDSIAARSALVVADACLIPCKPMKRDYLKLPKTAEVIDLAMAHNPNLKSFGLVTMAPSLPSLQSRIDKCKKFMVLQNITPINAFCVARYAIDDVSEYGLSPQESGDEKAKNEATAAYTQLLDLINE